MNDISKATTKSNKLLRVPSDLLAELSQWAMEEDRSVNSHIVRLLRMAVRARADRKDGVAA